MNVIVTGGGTAGHVFPALATAHALRDRHGATVLFIGADDGQEAALVPDAGFPFVGLRVAAAQSRFSLDTLRAIALAFRGSRRARSLVRGADVVVSIGGFASAPAVLAARRTHRPLVLIEPNTVPGVVNRIAARWASVVATTFAGTAARLPAGTRIERTGNPIRQEIRAVVAERDRLRAEAREAFDLAPDRTTVLVFGGSQGALHIDRTIAAALPLLRDRGDLQLLVSTGADAPRGRARGDRAGRRAPRSRRCRSSSGWTERLRSRIWPSREPAGVSPSWRPQLCPRSSCRTRSRRRTTRRRTPASS